MPSKPQRQTYFIRLPRAGGTEFVDVVPDQLSLNVITEIYEKDPGSGKVRYIRAHGVESLVNTGLDIADLQTKISDLSEQCTDNLKNFGEAGDAVAALLGTLKLPDLVSALAAQDVNQAEQLASDALYGYMAKACELAGKLAECQEKTELACDAMVGVSEIIDRAGLETDDYYTAWALSVENLNRTVEALERIERDLRALRDEIAKARQGWQSVLNANHPQVAEAVRFLDDPTDGFNFRAYRYRGETETRSEMEQAIATAREKVAALRGFETLAVESWEHYGRKNYQTIFPQRDQVRRLGAELGEAWGTLNDKELNSPKGAPRPFDSHGSLVSEQAYNCALDRMRDPKWGRLTAEKRLLHIIESIDGLRGDRPCLPPDIREAMDMAERSIDLIEADWRERDRRKTQSPPPVAAASPSIPPPSRPPDGGAPSAGPVGSPTAEELYELVCCVGCVMTANRNQFTCTTLKSACRILAYMGRCDEGTAKAAKDRLKELVAADAETLEAQADLAKRWRDSPKRWLRYHNGRAWVMKMAQQAETAVRRLMAKHGVTDASVKEAYSRMKADRDQEFAKKKAAE